MLFDRRLIASLMFLLLVTSCGLDDRDPQAVLDEALEQFAQQQPVVELETSGVMIRQEGQIAVHPLSDVALFRKHIAAVSLESALSTNQYIVLRVELTPEASKQAVLTQLIDQLSQIRGEVFRTGDAGTVPHSEQIRQAIDDRLNKAEQTLDHWTEQMSAQSYVQLWVERRSGMPQRMKVNTAIRYSENGSMRDEELIEHYTITS